MHVLLSLLGKGFTCAVKTGFHVLTAARTHPRSEKNHDFCVQIAHPHAKIAFSRVGWLRPHEKIKIQKKIKIKIIETLAAAAVRRHRSRRRHHSSSRCRRRHISSLSPSRHGERRRGASPPDPGHLIVVASRGERRGAARSGRQRRRGRPDPSAESAAAESGERCAGSWPSRRRCCCRHRGRWKRRRPHLGGGRRGHRLNPGGEATHVPTGSPT